MSNKSKRKGTGFEYRTRDYLTKLGAEMSIRMPNSGNSADVNFQSDVDWVYVIDGNEFKFRSECKKRNKPKDKMTFEVEWMFDVMEKSQALGKIPTILFSGFRMPIFIAVERNIFYALFGNYSDIKLKEYQTRGDLTLTLHWSQIQTITGVKNKVNNTLNGAIIKTNDIEMFIFSLDSFIEHLKHSLGFVESRYF